MRGGRRGGCVLQPLHRNNLITPTWCDPMMAASSRDWNVFKQIFADHWEPFQQAHPRYQTAYYESLVAKMLACGNPEKIGYSEYRCLHCGQGKPLVAMSCKSSLCLRCAKVSVDNLVSQVSKSLHEGVISRHIILTVPAMFRTTFYQNAAVVLSAFMRCGAQCLDDFYSDVRGKALRGGSITVLHTHGRNGQYHPHLHLLATSGGYDAPGRTLGAFELLTLCAAAPQVAVALAEYVAQDAQDRGDPPIGRCVFPEVSQRLGDQRAKGPSPLAVSERGALCGQICGEPPDLCPAY